MATIVISGATFDAVVDSLGQPQDMGRDWGRQSPLWVAVPRGRGYRYSHPATDAEADRLAGYLESLAGALSGGGFDPGSGVGAESRRYAAEAARIRNA